MMKFEKIVEIKKIKLQEENTKNIRKNIIKIQNLVKRIRNDSPWLTKDEVLEEMDETVLKWFFDINSDFSIQNTCILMAVNEVLESPQIILNKFKKLGIKELENYQFKRSNHYTVKLDIHLKCLVVDLFKNCKEINRLTRKYLKNELKPKEELNFKKEIVDTCQNYKSKIVARMKESISKQITTIATVLDKMGALSNYVGTNNYRLEKMKLEFLEIPWERDPEDYTLQVHAVEDLFDLELLEKMDMLELAAIDAFLMNRIAKEIQNYSQSMYILRKLNLLDALVNQDKIDLDDKIIFNDKLLEIRVQEELLKNHSEKIAKNFIKSKYTDLKEKEICDYSNVKVKSINNYVAAYEIPIEDVCRGIKEKYEFYYSKALKRYNNNFVDDYNYVCPRYNIKNLMYEFKEQVIGSLVILMLNSSTSKVSWGYIENDKNDYGAVRNKYVLLGFDIKGFNVPIKLHLYREKVIKIIDCCRDNSLIPVYEGGDDMMVGRNKINFSAQIVASLTTKQKKELVNYMKKIPEYDYRYNFLNHLNYMRNMSKRKIKTSSNKQYDLLNNTIIES